MVTRLARALPPRWEELAATLEQRRGGWVLPLITVLGRNITVRSPRTDLVPISTDQKCKFCGPADRPETDSRRRGTRQGRDRDVLVSGWCG